MISFFFQPVFLLLVSLIRSCLLSGLELVIIDNWFNPHLFVVLICLQLVEMVSLWIKLPFVKRRIQPKAARPAALLISAVLVVARIGLGIFLFMPFIRILALVSQSSNWAGLGMLALITFVLIKDTMISLIG